MRISASVMGLDRSSATTQKKTVPTAIRSEVLGYVEDYRASQARRQVRAARRHPVSECRAHRISQDRRLFSRACARSAEGMPIPG